MDSLSKANSGSTMEDLIRNLGSAPKGAESDETNDTAEITFSIIFYGLFAAMLVVFWFVFKRGQKTN